MSRFREAAETTHREAGGAASSGSDDQLKTSLLVRVIFIGIL